MRRIDARRKNASASLDDPAFGQDHKPADPIGTFDDFDVEMRQNF